MKTRREELIRLARSWAPTAAKVAAPKPVKKAMQIEPLLTWTFRQELPKAQRQPTGPAGMGNAYTKIARLGEELSLAGLDPNKYYVVPDLTAESLPHNDALEVFDAVCGLDQMAFFMATDWDPLNDWADLGDLGRDAIARALDYVTEPDEHDRRRWRLGGKDVKALVMRYALLGGAPDWMVEPLNAKIVRNQNGTVKYFRKSSLARKTLSGTINEDIEVDGYDRNARRPFPDAYAKAILEPDPFWTLVERAEYEIWLTALDVLVADLSGRLIAHEPELSPRPARPWETGDIAPPRILPTVRRPARSASAEKPPPSS